MSLLRSLFGGGVTEAHIARERERFREAHLMKLREAIPPGHGADAEFALSLIEESIRAIEAMPPGPVKESNLLTLDVLARSLRYMLGREA